ncbi:Abi family protein [Streptococcus sp. NLN76]|uniref:Abi family protein n=2 Tax=unclassified Streptococcus TaxID=2608887 RepID=UPI0018A9CD18|nr:Abi family protein [Streptococcus sp. NLN76]MBF8970637.1 Abi family protein [Streptococcus sp. NLN76]
MKPKLSFDELIEKFTSKGIELGTFNEEQIKDYLMTRSYYYKISSYRKNYLKLPNGKYDTLTFDHLEATARMDVRLREYLLHLCLDVEHSIRTRLMTVLTLDKQQDGYTIIESFQDKYPDKFNEVLAHFRNSSYKKDMFKKRTQISAWVFMEIIDYGTLVLFLEFCKGKVQKSELNLYESQHKFIKNIRNSCAHNDVYLINLFPQEERIARPQAASKTFCINMGINQSFVHFPKIGDLINLFYLHKKVCSDNLNQRRYSEGRWLVDYYTENYTLFQKSVYLTKFFNSIFIKSVDFLSS